jgi:hypothetical protein
MPATVYWVNSCEHRCNAKAANGSMRVSVNMNIHDTKKLVAPQTTLPPGASPMTGFGRVVGPERPTSAAFFLAQ